MPDPGGKKLLDAGCKVVYKKDSLLNQEKLKQMITDRTKKVKLTHIQFGLLK